MNAIVKLYSKTEGEIFSFLKRFYKNDINIDNPLFWQKQYENPVEIADIIATLIENKEDYNINMWISLDTDVFINITKNNADDIIRYLFERYPY